MCYCQFDLQEMNLVFEKSILLNHIKYIKLCVLKKLTINEVRRIMSLLERLFKTLYLWENIPKITTFNIL